MNTTAIDDQLLLRVKRSAGGNECALSGGLVLIKPRNHLPVVSRTWSAPRSAQMTIEAPPAPDPIPIPW